MNKLFTIVGLSLGLCLSAAAQAREVTITTTLNTYRGNAAHLAIYLTNPDGKYERTLWVAGKKSKYYKHLLDWARGSGVRATEYEGMTGASVSGGDSLTIKADIDDALIDAGYLIRVDSAVEDKRENRIDAEVTLTTSGAGTPVSGRGYVNTLSYSL
ncbi:DUF2271 domain-containing protein [Zhongshania sp.]|uniref:DUF2271 domain-containing protein n=1 Tax=Zhongshania sp. TaxID=1971902 RepID=UPI001B6C9D93|nr:DUF2271 domain-containing protein [Zhongshania sp.]MBQ0797085.1 DUF2271 domain-containing protein [Zhongshania sp.]